MEILKKDGIIFLINGILFAIAITLELEFINIYIGILIIGLLISYFSFKQRYSDTNTFKLNTFVITNVTGTVLLFLFGFNLCLSWQQLSWIEIAYAMIFCIIQLLVTNIYNLKDK